MLQTLKNVVAGFKKLMKKHAAFRVAAIGALMLVVGLGVGKCVCSCGGTSPEPIEVAGIYRITAGEEVVTDNLGNEQRYEYNAASEQVLGVIQGGDNFYLWGCMGKAVEGCHECESTGFGTAVLFGDYKTLFHGELCLFGNETLQLSGTATIRYNMYGLVLQDNIHITAILDPERTAAAGEISGG